MLIIKLLKINNSIGKVDIKPDLVKRIGADFAKTAVSFIKELKK